MSQGFTKGTPIDTDGTLSLNSDIVVPSQKAVRTYVASQIGTPVTNVTASAPILSSGGATPNISIPVATTLVDGYLSAIDWTTFNGKVPSTRTLTINGTTYDLSADRSWTISGGIGGSGTTNEIAYFTAATTLSSLTTATYPSLTELSYVKGATSNIQTQINALGGSYSSYTVKANNTGVSATPTDQTFRYPGNQNYTGTISAGALGNFGAGSYYYNWNRIGNMVHYTFQFYPNTGFNYVIGSNVSWDLPADMPNPLVPAAFNANQNWLIRNFMTVCATITSTTQSTFFGGLRVKVAATPTFEFLFTAAAALNGARVFQYSGTYFTS